MNCLQYGSSCNHHNGEQDICRRPAGVSSCPTINWHCDNDGDDDAGGDRSDTGA